MILEVALNSLQVGLDSLDLDQWRVSELGKKSEAFVDGSESAIVFSYLSFKDSMLIVSNFGLFIEGLSVLINVGSELSQSIL